MNVSTKLGWAALKYTGKKPLVLNIEISKSCNLKCKYCGKVKEDKGVLGFDKIVKAIDEVNTPIVYFTGGEPFLFFDELKQGVGYALAKNKIVFIVTNGTLVKNKLRDLDVNKENLVLMFSVDGLREKNDKIRGDGSFEKMMEGLMKAKEKGFNVWLNFTLYKENLDDLDNVVKFFKDKVDKIHLNLYYDYSGKNKQMKLDKVADKALRLKKETKHILNLKTYFKFWQGEDLECTPWGTVTLDVEGWRSPCYFKCNGHVDNYKKLMKDTDWEMHKKCRECKSHCGFEPTIYRNKKILVKELLMRL